MQTHANTQKKGSLALVGRACVRNANSHRRPCRVRAKLPPACCADGHSGGFSFEASTLTHSETQGACDTSTTHVGFFFYYYYYLC